MHEIGVIHGRFQILHNDHLKYLLAGKARCRRLLVGITNPDPTQTSKDAADPRRSAPENNPLTYYERQCMTRAALQEAGVALQDFDVVPFPINFPELYKYYLPLDAVFFLTVYDEWGERKLRMFQELGLKTEVLWRRAAGDKGLSATDVRRLIIEDGPWRELVPPAVSRVITRLGIRERLREPLAG